MITAGRLMRSCLSRKMPFWQSTITSRILSGRSWGLMANMDSSQQITSKSQMPSSQHHTRQLLRSILRNLPHPNMRRLSPRQELHQAGQQRRLRASCTVNHLQLRSIHRILLSPLGSHNILPRYQMKSLLHPRCPKDHPLSSFRLHLPSTLHPVRQPRQVSLNLLPIIEQSTKIMTTRDFNRKLGGSIYTILTRWSRRSESRRSYQRLWDLIWRLVKS